MARTARQVASTVRRAAMPHAPGDACDAYSWNAACPMATMASALAEHIQEKVLCHWCKQLVLFTHVRPPDTRPARCTVLNALPERRRGTISPYEANLHPKP